MPGEIAGKSSLKKLEKLQNRAARILTSSSWGNCRKKLSEKLEKLQNRAARILTSSSDDADAGYLLQQLSWKDLIAQHQTQVVLLVFKALNNLVPDQLSSMFTKRSTPGYVLRDSTDKLNVLLPRPI